jgi:hypothetical protein
LDIKKNVASLGEMGSADADLIVYEGIPCIPEEIMLCCENYHFGGSGGGGGGDDDGDNDTVSDEHIMPPPNHKDAVQYVSQLIKHSSARQPQFMNDHFLMYSNIETQWFADKMSTRQKKICEYFGVKWRALMLAAFS